MYRITSILCLAYLSLWQVTGAMDELLGYDDPSRNMYRDWDMETDPGDSAWIKHGRLQTEMLTIVPGGNTGNYSYKITGRSSRDNSVKQPMTGLVVGTYYYVSVFIKLLTDRPGRGYVTIYLMCKHGTDQGAVGRLSYQRVAEYRGGFRQLGGDFQATSTSAYCWLRMDPYTVDYQIDTASFTEIHKFDNPTEYLNKKIKEHRTSPLTVKGFLPEDCHNGKVNIELVRHEFGIGIALTGKVWTREGTAPEYQRKLVLNGTIPFNEVGFTNDLKWGTVERSKGNRKFDRVDPVLPDLLAHNMTIRGHTLMWALKDALPTWIQALKGDALKEEAMSRVQYMMDHLKEKVTEYDVINEEIHYHFWEDLSGDPDFMKNLFLKAHEVDPKATLCLNDYEVIRNGQYTSMIANQCEYLQQEGAPCNCIGIQGHMRETPFAPEVIWNRLSIAGRIPGVALKITEFSVHNYDLAIRADAAEMAIRIFMAHPKVKSFMFWTVGEQFGGFSDDYALLEGDYFTPNEAGQRVIDLLAKEMTTKEEIASTCSINHTIQHAFRGNYRVVVTCDGDVKVKKEFYLGGEACTVEI